MTPIPYIDIMLGQLEAAPPPPDGLHVHYGYWDTPPAGPVAEVYTAQCFMVERMLTELRVESGHQVLDVGCGVGGTLQALGNRVEGIRLTGLNYDTRQLDAARRVVRVHAHNSLSWVVADACAIPDSLGSFDRILALESPEHFASRLAFLKGAAKVLAPDGLLALSDIVSMSGLLELGRDPSEAKRLRAIIEAGCGPWPELWQAPDYQELGKQAGLEMVAWEDATVATMPSYPFFIEHARVDQLHALADALQLLESWSQARLVRYEIMSFRRKQPT